MPPVPPRKTTCDDSVIRSTSVDHTGSGGAMPASSLYFATGKAGQANFLVKEYHYSRRSPANVQLIGSLHLKDTHKIVAAAFFSIPPTRWSERVLELTRLVRTDDQKVPLSMLVSMCMKWLKHHTSFDLVVSFSDVTHNHTGIVYQSCSWNYHGLRAPQNDALVIDGQFVPRRTAYGKYGTSSLSKIVEMTSADVVGHWDDGKHLYWKDITKTGKQKADRLKLESNKYPKPNDEK